MDALYLLVSSTAVLATSAGTALACRFHYERRLAAERARTSQCEQARLAATERSTQARAQVTQLNKALAELKLSQETQQALKRIDDKRAEIDRALTAQAPTLVLPARRSPPPTFADTQPMV